MSETMTNAVTLTAELPDYAPDGSRGYCLTATRGWRMSGWIDVGTDGSTVYATIDRAPWRRVGTVASRAELTPAWIAEHAKPILGLG
jgi:hypothetical protein